MGFECCRVRKFKYVSRNFPGRVNETFTAGSRSLMFNGVLYRSH